jgi:hypothetical protein
VRFNVAVSRARAMSVATDQSTPATQAVFGVEHYAPGRQRHVGASLMSA